MVNVSTCSPSRSTRTDARPRLPRPYLLGVVALLAPLLPGPVDDDLPLSLAGHGVQRVGAGGHRDPRDGQRHYFERFRAELGTFKAEMRSEIASLRAELLKWMLVFWMGNVAATVGIVFAALKLSR
jgi:hypothetical protein